MGTNYYRIPSVEEVSRRKNDLERRLSVMDPADPKSVMDFGDGPNVWELYAEGISVHLGKRSSGWQFCWDHNNWKFYENPDEMIEFIKSGRVVDEYGEIWDTEEFIRMARNWTGKTHMEYYREQTAEGVRLFGPENYKDIVMDGYHYANYTDFS
jgi:hypothetical protein